MLTIQDHFITLVQDFTRLHHAPQGLSLQIVLLLFDGNSGSQRVPDEYGFRKTQPVVAVGECHRINLAGGQSDPDSEGHRAMGNPLPEWCLPRELGIHVMGEIVPGMARVNNDIGLGDRPA